MKVFWLLIGLALSSLAPLPSCAQGLFGVRPRPVHHFEDTQWYVGLVTGLTYSHPSVGQTYSEVASLVGTNPEKEYGSDDVQLGFTAGIVGTAALTPTLQVAASARYTTLTYSYQHSYQWEDVENPDNKLTSDHVHQHTLGYAEFPLHVRYGVPIQRFKPFFQAGIVYGRLLEAHKSITASTTDFASRSASAAVTTLQTIDVRNLYVKSYLGYSLGGGMAYNFGGVVVVLDAEYRRGFNTLTNASARYAGARSLAGLGNVPDDIKLNAVSGTLSFLFPLKFLTDKSFKPVIF